MQSKRKMILDFSSAAQLKHRRAHRVMLHMAHSHSFNFKSNKATTQFIRHNSTMENNTQNIEMTNHNFMTTWALEHSQFQSRGRQQSGAANLNHPETEWQHALRREAGDNNHRINKAGAYLSMIQHWDFHPGCALNLSFHVETLPVKRLDTPSVLFFLFQFVLQLWIGTKVIKYMHKLYVCVNVILQQRKTFF